jgi:hypothetical protein
MKTFIRNTTTALLAGTGFAFVLLSAAAPSGRAWAGPLSLRSQQSHLANSYSYIDPDHLVPSDLLLRALAFYDVNRGKFENSSYLSIINTSPEQKTLFVINLRDGFVSVDELSDSSQALSGFYLVDEDRHSKEVDLKIKSLSSGQSGGGWAQLQGIDETEKETLVSLLKGGSLLLAGVSTENSALQTAAAVATNSFVEVPPLWEARRKSDGRSWTLLSFDVIQKYGSNLMACSEDVEKFCPAYSQLTRNQKLNFWTYLVSGIVKFESGFNPTSRYHESTMGIDPVTKKPVYSEGLMQLSYQDIRSYPFCEFNWTADKYLKATDPKKTIFNPAKNLSCGIRILNQLVRKSGKIAFNSGNYWSSLQPKHATVKSIEAMTNAIPFCRK